MRTNLGSIFFATVLTLTAAGQSAPQAFPIRPPAAVPAGAQRAGSDPGRVPSNNPSMAELNATYERLAKTMRVTRSGELKNPAIAIPEFATLKMQKQAADVEVGQIMSASGGAGGTGPAGMLRTEVNVAAPPAKNTAAMLAKAPTTICSSTNIAAVNRSRTGVIFTTDRNTNLYTITGCGFGNTPGKLILEGGPGAFPAHAGKLGFLIKSWNDRGIVAMLDPSIVGEFDQENVTLLVEPATAMRGRLQSGPHKFIAARGQPILIPVMPKSAFCAIQGNDMKHGCTIPTGFAWGGAVVAPCGVWGLTDCSIEVFRQHPFVHPDVPWIDSYTPKLKPGFVISSVIIQVVRSEANGGDVRTLTPTVNAKQVFIRMPLTRTPVGDGYDSLYGVTFYAVGPVGITNPLAD